VAHRSSSKEERVARFEWVADSGLGHVTMRMASLISAALIHQAGINGVPALPTSKMSSCVEMSLTT
jgi:hypothetical protein